MSGNSAASPRGGSRGPGGASIRVDCHSFSCTEQREREAQKSGHASLSPGTGEGTGQGPWQRPLGVCNRGQRSRGRASRVGRSRYLCPGPPIRSPTLPLVTLNLGTPPRELCAPRSRGRGELETHGEPRMPAGDAGPHRAELGPCNWGPRAAPAGSPRWDDPVQEWGDQLGKRKGPAAPSPSEPRVLDAGVGAPQKGVSFLGSP